MALPQIQHHKNSQVSPYETEYIPQQNAQPNLSICPETDVEAALEPIHETAYELNDVELIPAELESSSSFLNRISFFVLLTLLASFLGLTMGIIFGMLLLTGKLDMYHDDVVMILKSVKPLIMRYFM